MNYWELAAWIAAAVCLAAAGRYRHLYLIGRKEIQIYNQLITRIDTGFGHMHLSLLWRPELAPGGQWTVQDCELKTPRYGPPYLEQLAADPNWTVALQNAVHRKQLRQSDTAENPPAA